MRIWNWLAFATIRSGVRLPARAHLERFLFLVDLRQVLEHLAIDCVLDVGANQGQFGRQLRRIGYSGWIVSFEPNHADVEVLERHRDPKWLVYELGLAQEDGERQLNIGEWSVLSSFRTSIKGRVERTVVVATRRLDGLLDEILSATGARRLFLKVDTQGFDVEVIKGTGARIAEMRGLLSELSVTPIYKHMPHFVDALRLYEELGFRLHSLHIVNRVGNDVGDKSVLEYDGLMLRREPGAASST